ncbi:MAG: hypothetical protein IJQ31_01410 [Thermoguttaceae bacterium]|nr:hypothetical protein [Thermoguttaceae bacterium]
MKILKFLHASNFQLHMPVTCWSTPFWEKREVSNSANDSVDELAGTPGPVPTLSLERTGSWLFGAAFPELPPALSEECLSAPWKSAERVFDLALAQNVDFLLLTGDVLQPDLTGIRGLVFLIGQFNRLRERGISVYWKLERSIEEWMLPNFRFPENVFLFPSNETHIKKFRLADSPKNIFIASWNSPRPDFSRYDFSKLADGKLPPAQTIALCPDEETFLSAAESDLQKTSTKWTGTFFENQISFQESDEGVFESKFQTETPISTVSYVALTENRDRLTLRREFPKTSQSDEMVPTILHTPGPIQHRSPDIWETRKPLQPAGVSIVQLDLDGDLAPSLQFFPTETLAWRFLEREIPTDVLTWESLRNWLINALKEEFPANIPAETTLPDRALVYWRLTAKKQEQTRFLRQLFQETMKTSGVQSQNENLKMASLLKSLRDAGKPLPARPWSVCIAPNRGGLIPYSWEQGESMLSDFLRLSQFHLKNPSKDGGSNILVPENFVPHSLDLNETLTDEQLAAGLEVMGRLDAAEEKAFLELAGILGAQAFAETQEGDRKK